MAELFLAHVEGATGYEGTVVVKTLRSDEARVERAARALRGEGRVGQSLSHPNIVRLVEADLEAERPHLVMEFVFGRDLARVLRRCAARGETMPVDHVRTVMADLLDALSYTHGGGRRDGPPIVHQDVSPQNLMLGFDGWVRLVDFGLASGGSGDEGLGKVPYVAPERLMNRDVDARSDVFGAGVVLWEMLSQRTLFERSDPRATAKAVLRGRVPWPHHPERGVPWGLAFAAWRALRRRPVFRFQSALDFRKAVAPWGPSLGDRTELAAWLRHLYAPELESRQRMLDSLRGSERQRFADGGLELLPLD